MTPAELAADLRTRINPKYADQLGTESYERRICADVIFQLLKESDAQRKVLEQAQYALESTLEALEQLGPAYWSERQEEARVAITAMQEQLK